MSQIERENALRDWCQSQLGFAAELQALSGDASFRRYFRIKHEGQSWMAADAPPETEKNQEFVAIAKLLEVHNILAPRVHSYDLEHGFLLQNDLGDQTLLPLLNSDTVDGYYQRCLDQIVKLQTMSGYELPAYDASALRVEMELFPTWFVGSLLGYKVNEQERLLINKVFDQLIASAEEQPQVFVHRDYHSRNIMLVDEQIATIDFQDALHGPMTYDLVSILRDCYIEWPQQQVETWVQSYYQKAQQANLIEDVSFETFMRWFDWMGLQRHIKVLGIFARLSIRDNKHGYLLDLPLVMKYTREVLAQYSQDEVLSEFLAWFDEKLLPLANQQDWIKGRAA